MLFRTSRDLEIQFKLSITGYAENKNGDSVSYEKVTDENVTNFLNGHIMFLRNMMKALTHIPIFLVMKHSQGRLKIVK